MSLYRKVEQQTWGDKKFQALSPLLPCGQALWLYLLTGPQTSILPGLLRAGRAAMAEELGWSLKGFDEAFAEPFREGMVKADWKARLVWLPKALRDTNKPDNPNVARAWGKAFDLLPECDLKAEAGDAICLFLAGLGPSYLAAFTGDPAEGAGVGQASGKPSPKTSGNPSGKGSRNGSSKGSQKGSSKQETGNRRSLKDPHTARAREAVPPGRVVPFDTPPEQPRHCGYHSDNAAFNVPPGLHAQFVGRLVHAGWTPDEANEELFKWYPAVEAAWTGRHVVGDNDFKFWWARFGEVHGTTVRSVEPTKVAGLAGGGVVASAPRASWRCTHEWPHCHHRAECEVVTARDVREGRLALEDVQPALRETVRAMVEDQAVHA